MERLSGDQKGVGSPAVGVKGLASSVSSERTHRCNWPSSPRAVKATFRPSGESVIQFVKVVFGGADDFEAHRLDRRRLPPRRPQRDSHSRHQYGNGRDPRHPTDPRRSLPRGSQSSRRLSSNSQASPISRSRFFGSFSRHFFSSRRTWTGACSKSGAFITTAARVPSGRHAETAARR